MPEDLSIVEPAADKLHRAAYLMRGSRVRPEARFLVAVKMQPLEHFTGALAWWPEGSVGRFLVSCLPGVDRRTVAAELVRAVIRRGADAGLESLQYADLLTEQSEWLPVLAAERFYHLRSERFFEIAYPDAWARVTQLYAKHKRRIPADWRTQSACNLAPEIVAPFVSPHRLMPPEELRQFWRPEMAGGFDLEFSSVLFSREKPFGAFLLRPVGNTLLIDVLVVQHSNALLRSLGELCLFYHGVSRLAPDGAYRALQFRSGESEHRQTANLALRMGGRELAKRNVYARRLGT